MGTPCSSDQKRPIHLGPYPLERFNRNSGAAKVAGVPSMPALSFQRPERPESLAIAMGEARTMINAIEDGVVTPVSLFIPTDPRERSSHREVFGYYTDV